MRRMIGRCKANGALYFLETETTPTHSTFGCALQSASTIVLVTVVTSAASNAGASFF